MMPAVNTVVATENLQHVTTESILSCNCTRNTKEQQEMESYNQTCTKRQMNMVLVSLSLFFFWMKCVKRWELDANLKTSIKRPKLSFAAVTFTYPASIWGRWIYGTGVDCVTTVFIPLCLIWDHGKCCILRDQIICHSCVQAPCVPEDFNVFSWMCYCWGAVLNLHPCRISVNLQIVCR